jgi:flagellar hook-associated protein 1 FlgK
VAARGVADQVNSLSTQVAQLNAQITGANGANVETLIDQRDVAISQLSSLVGAVQTPSSDGSIGLSVGQGHPLVIGSTAYQMTVGSGAGGLATFSVLGANTTSELTGGQMGGLLAVRDTLVPGYQAQLDQLAHDLATEVNTVHAAGVTGTGRTNQNFFTPPAAVAGSAAALAVDPALVANSNLVAASATGAAGDNQTAQAIAALRTTGFVGGSATPSDSWAQLVFNVGSDTSSATSAETNQQQIIAQLTQMRDAVSKVSTDDEAASLMKFQRAYEANARYFTTIDQTLDTLMAMVATV